MIFNTIRQDILGVAYGTLPFEEISPITRAAAVILAAGALSGVVQMDPITRHTPEHHEQPSGAEGCYFPELSMFDCPPMLSPLDKFNGLR